MRVFPDTNVLTSALLGRGLCRDLLDRLLVEHTVVIGVPVRNELERVLVKKFRVPDILVVAVVSKLKELEQAPPAKTIPSFSSPDPDDQPILACALEARIDVFITGDKALLEMKRIERMAITSPRGAWERLTKGK